jgi:multidrug efflux pump subunit AcrA (membrane-fusion protein)
LRRRYWIGLFLAAGLLGFAVYEVVAAQHQEMQKTDPPGTTVPQPPDDALAGSGIVEARTEDIAVAAHRPGVVAEVKVKVLQQVRAGESLFRLDDRELLAELKWQEAELAYREAELARLEQMPRQEELPVSTAKVRHAAARLVDQRLQFDRFERLSVRGASSREQHERCQQAVEMARQQLALAEAEDRLVRAGAWGPEKAVAQAAVARARARVGRVRTELDRLIVRAPVAGEVLQVNVRPGEYVNTPPSRPPVVLGDTSILHVRVDIDEHDIHRFRPGAPAHAHVRMAGGDLQRKPLPLRFVRVEPYVVPKRSGTGNATERLDTRVLQVIYALDPEERRLLDVYVGRQLDVFIAP